MLLHLRGGREVVHDKHRGAGSRLLGEAPLCGCRCLNRRAAGLSSWPDAGGRSRRQRIMAHGATLGMRAAVCTVMQPEHRARVGPNPMQGLTLGRAAGGSAS